MSGNTNDKIKILQESDEITDDSNDGSEKPVGTSLTDRSYNNTPASHDAQHVQKVVKKFSVMKKPYANDDNLKYIASFDSEFRDFLGISPISLEKAWIHNLDEVKLVDFERERVLREFNNKYINAVFYRLKGVDEMGIIYLDPTVNLLLNLRVKNPLQTIIDFNYVTRGQVYVFIVLKSDKIVAFVKKTEGFACCQKVIPYLQLYSQDGTFLREAKLQHEGKNIIDDANEMVENNNGDIIISGDTHAPFDLLVVVDSNFKFRFTFEGAPNSNLAVSSLAVDRMNNIYFVNHLQCIEVINQNGNFLRTFPIQSFSAEGLPSRIAIDSYDQIWIVTNLDKIVCIQL